MKWREQTDANGLLLSWSIFVVICNYVCCNAVRTCRAEHKINSR